MTSRARRGRGVPGRYILRYLEPAWKSGDVRLGCLPLPGEAAAHGDDHGPVDDGLVVCGQPLVVAGGAAVAGDPGQGAPGDPAAGQHLEGVQVTGARDELDGDDERGPGPGDELASVVSLGPREPVLWG